MEENRKQFTLRLDEKIFTKIEVIAKKNKRSVNGQIEFLLEECIFEYEQKYGNIDLPNT
jgi:hypothetical protein